MPAPHATTSVWATLARRAALLAAVLACADETGPAPPGIPASMEIVGGDAQSGEVGTELPAPLVVRVRDSAGTVVPNQIVNFRVTAGGGSVFAGVSLTNSAGLAQDRWTIGTSTADSQRVEARAVDNNTGQPLTFAVFAATALPGPPFAAAKVAGDSQTAAMGLALPESLSVRIADRFGNPVPGVDVTWSVQRGGGTVSPSSVTSGSMGQARTAFMLGPRLDSTHVARASVAALAPADFVAVATLPATALIAPTGGDGQTGTVQSTLPESLEVTVRLVDGRAVRGSAVTWSTTDTSARLDPQVGVTDSAGRARVRWLLGRIAGVQRADATTASLAPATFTATATPGPAVGLAKTAGDDQVGFAFEPLPDTVVAKVEDQYGNGVPGIVVSWQVTAGGGTVNAPSSTSDGAGLTGVRWTLGADAGPDSLVATAPGIAPTTFAATTALPVIAIDASVWGGGQAHTCAVTNDNRGYCWGANWAGQLGDGTTNASLVPQAVVGGLAFQTIAVGSSHTCALTTAGDVYCWGANVYGERGDGTPPSGNPSNIAVAPVRVVGGLTWTAVTTDLEYTCGLATTGQAYCWGRWRQGAGGNSTPLPVDTNLTFTTLHAGQGHACGLTAAGEAYCWGNDYYGQIGDSGGPSSPFANAATRVRTSLTFTAIAPSEDHTCAIATTGTGYCWGKNDIGQLGDSTLTNNLAPSRVAGGFTWTRLAGGAQHTCGISGANAQAYCWGRGYEGQNGNGTFGPFGVANWPRYVERLHRYQSLAAGFSHTCGVREDGAALCWGDNAAGQLGTGTTTPSAVPVRVKGPT
jgi:hypothetical protein